MQEPMKNYFLWAAPTPLAPRSSEKGTKLYCGDARGVATLETLVIDRICIEIH